MTHDNNKKFSQILGLGYKRDALLCSCDEADAWTPNCCSCESRKRSFSQYFQLLFVRGLHHEPGHEPGQVIVTTLEGKRKITTKSSVPRNLPSQPLGPFEVCPEKSSNLAVKSGSEIT